MKIISMSVKDNWNDIRVSNIFSYLFRKQRELICIQVL